MKIISYTRQKNGQYKIRLEDDSCFLVHEDLILKYELLIKKEVTDKLKDKILSENKQYSVYDDAVKYLSRKMRSAHEMREYLKKKEYFDDLIDSVIKKLKDQGYINDLAYSKAYVHDRIVLSNDGPYKIEKDLKKNMIKQEYIIEALNSYTEDIEKEKIEKLILKAIKTNHTKGKRVLKQKTFQDLVNLGYHKEVVSSLLYLFDDMDDEEIYKKEYDKLYSKLSKKYSGTELEYCIKQKLYQKGL